MSFFESLPLKLSAMDVVGREPLSGQRPTPAFYISTDEDAGVHREQIRLVARRRLSKTACYLLVLESIKITPLTSIYFIAPISSSSKHYGLTAYCKRDHTALSSCFTALYHGAAGRGTRSLHNFHFTGPKHRHPAQYRGSPHSVFHFIKLEYHNAA